MLSKENKDLVQIQQGNLGLSDFPDMPETEFARKDQIQSGKTKGAKPDESPAMGSGFHHDIFEKG